MFNETPADELNIKNFANPGALKYEKYMKDAERKMQMLNRQLNKDFDFDQDLNESYIIN